MNESVCSNQQSNSPFPTFHSNGPAMGIPDEGEFEENTDDIPFQYSHGITQAEAERLLIIYGRNELPEKTIPKWYNLFFSYDHSCSKSS